MTYMIWIFDIQDCKNIFNNVFIIASCLIYCACINIDLA